MQEREIGGDSGYRRDEKRKINKWRLERGLRRLIDNPLSLLQLCPDRYVYIYIYVYMYGARDLTRLNERLE